MQKFVSTRLLFIAETASEAQQILRLFPLSVNTLREPKSLPRHFVPCPIRPKTADEWNDYYFDAKLLLFKTGVKCIVVLGRPRFWAGLGREGTRHNPVCPRGCGHPTGTNVSTIPTVLFRMPGLASRPCSFERDSRAIAAAVKTTPSNALWTH